MITLEMNVVINKPVNDVYSLMADPDRLPEWATGALEVRRESGNPGEVGARYEQVSQFLGRQITVTYEVTRAEPNKRFSFEGEPGSIPFDFDYKFQPSDSGTEVKVTIEGDPAGLFKLAEPVLAIVAMRQFTTRLETLKELMESGELVSAPV